MKKIIALLLAVTAVLGLAACGNGGAQDTTTEPAVVIESAVELINTVWNAVPEDNKFFAMGGDMNNITDNAAGVYGLEDQEAITSTLLIPADQIANVDEAASLMHAMLANNFTCGAFHVTGDKAAFVEAMHSAVANNQWICGMPEKLIIAEIGEYVLVAFGINDAIAPFETALTTAYPTANMKYSEAITG